MRLMLGDIAEESAGMIRLGDDNVVKVVEHLFQVISSVLIGMNEN